MIRRVRGDAGQSLSDDRRFYDRWMEESPNSTEQHAS